MTSAKRHRTSHFAAGAGRVQGVAKGVSPAAGLRVVCYCKDCQAFARFRKRVDVLDQAGGTDVFQTPPRRIKITAGTNAVRCLRVGTQEVYRWYADCCRTPIGNAMGPRVPMIGVIHCFMDHQADGRPRDVVLDPPLCRIFEHSAVPPLPPTAPPPLALGVSLRRISKLLVWSVRGFARPNPFFDDSTGAPCSAPRILTWQERAAFETAVVSDT